MRKLDVAASLAKAKALDDDFVEKAGDPIHGVALVFTGSEHDVALLRGQSQSTPDMALLQAAPTEQEAVEVAATWPTRDLRRLFAEKVGGRAPRDRLTLIRRLVGALRKRSL